MLISKSTSSGILAHFIEVVYPYSRRSLLPNVLNSRKVRYLSRSLSEDSNMTDTTLGDFEEDKSLPDHALIATDGAKTTAELTSQTNIKKI